MLRPAVDLSYFRKITAINARIPKIETRAARIRAKERRKEILGYSVLRTCRSSRFSKLDLSSVASPIAISSAAKLPDPKRPSFLRVDLE